MHFVHRSQSSEDCIAAIATAAGEGGIAIVRISGRDALQVGNRLFTGPVDRYASHTAHFGRVVDQNGAAIDEALCLVMHGPRSFTGQDTVELQCHGGALIARRILETALQSGARAAEPGEFSYRAFINGKLDLTQAEAIQEAIGAKSERALAAAASQLQGRLSERIRTHQQALTDIAAILNAWVDFPEEGLEFASMDDLVLELDSVVEALQSLAATFHEGRILKNGIAVCLAGRPNVGKSSLMNALLDNDRAIVTNIAGTTRDTLEDDLRLNGLHLRLIDTAGIRDTDEIVEAEGIRRSKQAMEQADLILLLLDASIGVTDTDAALIASVPAERTVLVWNKMDLAQQNPSKLDFPHVIEISALTGDGLDALREAIDAVIWEKGPPDKEELVITSVRHRDALLQAAAAATAVAEGLRSAVSPEFLTYEMRCCLVELGTILGCNITEEVLSSIFAKFCLGK